MATGTSIDARRGASAAKSFGYARTSAAERLRDDLAHLMRREKIVTRLRPPEAGKVDRQHLELLRQPLPHRSEREDALRPWTEEHNLLTILSARGVAHFEPIDCPPRDVEAW